MQSIERLKQNFLKKLTCIELFTNFAIIIKNKKMKRINKHIQPVMKSQFSNCWYPRVLSIGSVNNLV